MSLKKIILSTVFIFFTVGCTSMRFNDFFMGYALQMKQAVGYVSTGQFEQAKLHLPDYGNSHNAYNLSLLESGRIAFLMKQWPQSEKTFAQAYQAIDEQKQKAKIQISRGVENLGAVVSNDSALSYRVPAYEQTMLHSYQALNYLFQRDKEAALVEVRRANLVQEQALKDYEQELLDAQDSLKAKGVELQSLFNSYPNMDETIGDLKNGFQNAFTFYLSGVLYEANGNLDSAYIDYKRAIDIFSSNAYLQKDVLRLAKQLNRQDELRKFEEQFATEAKPIKPKHGEVVVVFEQGVVSARQEFAVNLPIFTRHNDMRFFNFALPAYPNKVYAEPPLRIEVLDKAYQSESIVNILALANRQLKDQLPEMVTRQAVRIAAKEEMRRKMQKNSGDVGNILAGLYSLASERADTRSWLTLPKDITIARMELPVGKQQLKLDADSSSLPIEVNVRDGKISLVYVNQLGNKMISHQVAL